MKKTALIIFGIILALFFLEFSFYVMSFILNSYKKDKIKNNLQKKDTIVIMCIGESLTENQYTKYLYNDLEKRNIHNVKVIDEGVGGINSDYIINNVLNQAIE